MTRKKREQKPTAKGEIVVFKYNGFDITRDELMLVNLTAMWRAAGSPANKEPRQWRRKEGASFIQHTSKALNVPVGHVLRSESGRNGSTWAHWQIALAYAKYLSDEFHSYVNEAFREWSEEKANPGLKLERGIEGYQRQGREGTWINARVEGILARKDLTHTMADHNCKVKGANDNPFAEGTRSISLAVTGKTPSEVKADRGAAKSGRTRDTLTAEELTWTRLAELKAVERIRQKGADGNQECVDCVRDAAKATKAARAAFDSQMGQD